MYICSMLHEYWTGEVKVDSLKWQGPLPFNAPGMYFHSQWRLIPLFGGYQFLSIRQFYTKVSCLKSSGFVVISLLFIAHYHYILVKIITLPVKATVETNVHLYLTNVQLYPTFLAPNDAWRYSICVNSSHFSSSVHYLGSTFSVECIGILNYIWISYAMCVLVSPKNNVFGTVVCFD